MACRYNSHLIYDNCNERNYADSFIASVRYRTEVELHPLYNAFS